MVRPSGRRRIPMQMIASRTARSVAFSKRRANLFKKASELAILTGTKLAIIVMSPSGKPYSYGHPSLRVTTDGASTSSGAHSEADIDALCQEYNDLVEKLAVEKERNKTLREERLNMLEFNVMELEKLKERVQKRINAPFDLNVPYTSDMEDMEDMEEAS